jgi:hypothetical protein
MPDPLTFLSQTGEPEVVTVQQKLVELVELTPPLQAIAVEDPTIELLTIMVPGQKGDPGVGDVENAILDGGTFN